MVNVNLGFLTSNCCLVRDTFHLVLSQSHITFGAVKSNVFVISHAYRFELLGAVYFNPSGNESLLFRICCLEPGRLFTIRKA